MIGRRRTPACGRAAQPARHLHHDGDDHAGARHHDRQCGAALHAGLAFRLARPDQLGADLVHRRRGRDDGAGRLARRPFRPQEAVHRLRRRLHGRVAALRAVAEHRADRGVPPAAGHVRRRAGAAVAIRDARCLSDRAARPGDGHLGHGRDARADHGADARRLPHRKLLLALGVPGQHPGRHPDGHRPAGVHGRDQAPRASALRLVRLRRARCRHRQSSTDARPRRAARLVHLARDHRRGDRLGRSDSTISSPTR